MSEMSNQNYENKGVNGTGLVGEGSSPGSCFLVRQQGSGRHHTTVRTKCSKNVNKIVVECFFRSKPFDYDGQEWNGNEKWKYHGVIEITEQRLCDQERLKLRE